MGLAPDDELVAHMLTLRQPLPPAISDAGVAQFYEIDLTIGIVPPEGQHSAGVVLVPRGTAQVQGAIGAWAAEIAVEGPGRVRHLARGRRVRGHVGHAVG